ncbi:MAG TPA: transketolase C-terminal domain-containing protein, partial [Enhygromyxa sp.]|nr:transketolase C-terminal domain-containing protein [Enhygromyxa sp.]
EDVGKRFEAYGWQVLACDGHDHAAVRAAIEAARADRERPSLIRCRTTIAKGAPNKAGSSDAHGAPLGAAEVAAAKQLMGWPTEPSFHVPTQVSETLAAQREQLSAQRAKWQERVAAYQAANATLGRELAQVMRDELPERLFDGFEKLVASFAPGGSIATRKAGQKVLAELSAGHPTLLGGSADLAGSNGVNLPNTGSHSRRDANGRNIHFGVREHGMAGICNGIALHGGLRVFDATFLVFSDFMRGALRLSALMGLPIVHVFTHDSFWLGEDGPTHQPIEHIMSLRAMPNLHVMRPGDARETVGAWAYAMRRTDGPTALLLTRQNLPTYAQTDPDKLARGAYVLWEPDGPEDPGPLGNQLDGIFIATGSELQLAFEAARALADRKQRIRVVSMPCWEAFAAQDRDYQESVLPRAVGRERRMAIEAGATLGWERYAEHVVGIDHFGASAPAEVLAEKFGFTVAAVLERWLSR